jgi:hypothetical protein
MDISIGGRVVIAIVLLGGFVLASRLVSVAITRHLRILSGNRIDARPGYPELLYFWTNECTLCKPQELQIAQARRILERSGVKLRVRRINAHEDAALVHSMGVMTVPTTVVLDQEGKVSAWNPGLTSARRIVHQMGGVAGQGSQVMGTAVG